MPNEIEAILSVSDSVVLDGSGNGTLDFDVDNAWQRWEITAVRVKTNQGDTQTPYPTAEIFNGPIAAAFSEGATWTGNNDTFRGAMTLDQGSELHIVFTGGVAGTIATAKITGKKYTLRGGNGGA